MTTIERVAMAIWDARATNEHGKIMLPWGAVREREMRFARAAIEAMRDPPVSVQIGAMEAMLQDVIDNDGPVKPQEDCKTASDWMDRGYSLGKRMLSGHDVTVCFNGAIDHILKDEA